MQIRKTMHKQRNIFSIGISDGPAADGRKQPRAAAGTSTDFNGIMENIPNKNRLIKKAPAAQSC